MKLKDIFKCNEEMYLFIGNCKGFDEFRRGGYSSVYFINEDLVLKVTNDTEYLKFLNLAREHQEIRSFPVIHDSIQIDKEVYILMERLEPYYDDYENDAEIAGYYCKDASLWKGVNAELDIGLDFLDNYWLSLPEEIRPTWDLRTSNIMKRGKDLVITDPWCE